MKRYILKVLIAVVIINVSCHSQENNSILNLDFEDVENGMLQGWIIKGSNSDYLVCLDSVTVKSGKYSVAIESITDSVDSLTFKSINLFLPNYYGKKITLTGYMKTENIAEGYATFGLMTIPFAFDSIPVSGTTDWEKYEVTLDLNSAKVKEIIIVGGLVGKGKMWLDDFQVFIDGKNISKLKYKPETFSEKAKNDREFDKGSNIVFPELNGQKTDDLELLRRIWGFLKYHHPAIAKGNYNWDSELFRILPAYLNANNHKQRDKILTKWINKYGRIQKCKTCEATPDSAFLKPDLSWIEHGNINPKLKDLLHNIYLNRNQGNHYYIDIHSVGFPLFTNEKTYGSMNYPDAGFRLLALYRYWNMIQYFSPYKYLTDKDWNTVLREYIPYFIEAENKQEYRLTATLLIAEVCDSHSYLDEEPATVESLNTDLQVPARLQFVENKLVVMEYFDESDQLKKGDILTHINGKPVDAIVDSMKKFFPGSNEAAKMRDIAREILRFDKKRTYIRMDSGNNLYINVSYISSDLKKEQKNIWLISRSGWMYEQYRKEDTTRSYRFIDKDIGYITLKTIKNADIPTIKKEFSNTKGIIIDIRNYPSAFTPFTLAPYFVSQSTPFVKFTQGNVNNPGEFTFRAGQEIPKANETYKNKLVVIVNENTQSSAEYQSMAFRAGNNTTIIGSQTAGADGNVTTIILPGGLETRISGIGIYYPDGRETQRIGIVPDIEVKPTIQGIREGRDELLEKAVEIIRKNE